MARDIKGYIKGKTQPLPGSVTSEDFWSLKPFPPSPPLISARIAIGRDNFCPNADWSKACIATASPREMPRMHQLPALDM